MVCFNNEKLNSGTNPPLQTSRITFDVAIVSESAKDGSLERVFN